MDISTGYDSGRLVIYLAGELDHHGARQTMRTIDGLIDEFMPRDAVLDLGGLSFMDSSGIAVILRAERRMRELGGRAFVENPAAQPLRVLDASGIDRLVSIKATRQGAKGDTRQ